MCGTAGQLEIDFEPQFSRRNIERWRRALNQMRDLSPWSHRVSIDTEGVIVIQNKNEPQALRARFAWYAEKKTGGTWPVFNLRVEGGWANKSDEPNYKGPFQIFTNPYAKDLIMTQRCLIPVDFFIEQPSDRKVKKKYLIGNENKQPFFLGGIYNEFVDQGTGEIRIHFAIMTTAYTPITIRAEHRRSPLIVPVDLIDTFLDPLTTKDTLTQFFYPADSTGMICYQVHPDISKKKDHPFDAKDPRYIKPLGEILRPAS